MDNANVSSMTCGTGPSQLFLQLQRIHELFHGVHNVKEKIGALLTLLGDAHSWSGEKEDLDNLLRKTRRWRTSPSVRVA